MEAETPDAFLARVADVAATEWCYVVTGTGAPDSFLEAVAELVPLVLDPNLPDATLLVTGHPSEWRALPGPLTPA